MGWLPNNVVYYISERINKTRDLLMVYLFLLRKNKKLSSISRVVRNPGGANIYVLRSSQGKSENKKQKSIISDKIGRDNSRFIER